MARKFKGVILFVDDDRRSVKPYVDELEEAGYTVILEEKVDIAYRKFTRMHTKLVLVVLDLMMPPGKLFGSDPRADLGLRTGELLLDKLRELSSKIPVVVLSNVSNEKRIRDINARPHTTFCSKATIFPWQLAETVDQLLAGS